ncbi:MAG: hypothetical protein AAB416_04350 [Patescibacteria group bacterium]
MAREEVFIEQMQWADIIYFHGGRSEKLLQVLKKYPDFAHHFRGKIIGADSAGANALSSVFFSKTIGIGEGFGIIPTKIICHFKNEQRAILDQVRPELPLLCLSEYQFKTFILNY